MHGHGHGGDAVFPMMAMMGGFFILLVLAATLLASRIPAVTRMLEQRHAGAAPPVLGPSPREILDRRLAEGSIEVSDYRSRVAELNQATGHEMPQGPADPQQPYA